jgi:ribose 5-phosphate isomerase A
VSFPTSSLTPDQRKAQAAHKAVEYIQDGQILGLGTGSTVNHFLTALGKRVRDGLRVRGVPTSQATATYATQLSIPLLDNDDPWDIDIAVDGADQVDPQLNLIKGGGGALLREKIVARAARQFIVIVDQAKQFPHLGLPFPLPVEILSFGWRTADSRHSRSCFPRIIPPLPPRSDRMRSLCSNGFPRHYWNRSGYPPYSGR